MGLERACVTARPVVFASLACGVAAPIVFQLLSRGSRLIQTGIFGEKWDAGPGKAQNLEGQ